jgi:hypothetical protein
MVLAGGACSWPPGIEVHLDRGRRFRDDARGWDIVVPAQAQGDAMKA